MIPNIDLDHVAVAVEHQAEAWPRYGGDLPSRWVGGGGTAGFWSAQVQYANGMKVEVLEPYLVEQNDFLRRFLDRSGPGPHHLTFKVKDLRGALDLATVAGYRPVGVNLENEWWMEAFLHPRDAPGVVVQLAQSTQGSDWGGDPSPDWFPAPRTSSPATLVHVAHALADLEEGRRLFVDLLGGRVVAERRADGITWLDLAWPGPGRVRLLAGEPMAEWLEERSGRVHHLAFVTDEPGDVDDARATPSAGTFEVPPSSNQGVRLLLRADPGPFASRPLG
ncbi:MAG TPA: VOC family protein [Acidimicrobiales bacterium]|nr:VOC family protein [Acidimicrobiales bacterium]